MLKLYKIINLVEVTTNLASFQQKHWQQIRHFCKMLIHSEITLVKIFKLVELVKLCQTFFKVTTQDFEDLGPGLAVTFRFMRDGAMFYSKLGLALS